MKKTPIDSIPIQLPYEIENLTRGALLFDSSCSNEAKVYYIKSESGYYLKAAKPETLKREAEMDRYFNTLELGPEVIYYGTLNDVDLLLTREVKGEDCTFEKYLKEPKRLAVTLGKDLRHLHSIPIPSCPLQNRLNEYLLQSEQNYKTGNFDSSQFPDSFGYKSAEDAYSVMSEGKHLLSSDTLIHGDFCLPNIILDNWQLSSYIDLGCAGVADRHIDLFSGAWTLSFNLGTDKYRDVFFDAYGSELIDKEKIKIIAAIEVFG